MSDEDVIAEHVCGGEGVILWFHGRMHLDLGCPGRRNHCWRLLKLPNPARRLPPPWADGWGELHIFLVQSHLHGLAQPMGRHRRARWHVPRHFCRARGRVLWLCSLRATSAEQTTTHAEDNFRRREWNWKWTVLVKQDTRAGGRQAYCDVILGYG